MCEEMIMIREMLRKFAKYNTISKYISKSEPREIADTYEQGIIFKYFFFIISHKPLLSGAWANYNLSYETNKSYRNRKVQNVQQKRLKGHPPDGLMMT